MIELRKEPVKPRVLLALEPEKYHAVQALSSSIIRKYEEDYNGCPLKAKHSIEGGDQEPTQAMEFGTSLHALILEPDYFDKHFAIMDDAVLEPIFEESKRAEIEASNYLQHETYDSYQEAGLRGFTSMGLTKKLVAELEHAPKAEDWSRIYAAVREEAISKASYAKCANYEEFAAQDGKLHACKAFKRWYAESKEKGLEVVKPAQLEKLRGMQQSLRANADVMEHIDISAAVTELSLFATIPVTVDQVQWHLPVKARLDWYFDEGDILDLKSARSAGRVQFSRQCAGAGYDRQAAWYWFVARQCGLDVRSFGFLACESEAPYLSTIHEMPLEWIEYSHSRNLITAVEVARSIAHNDWPGIPSGMMLPPSYLETIIDEWALNGSKSLTKKAN